MGSVDLRGDDEELTQAVDFKREVLGELRAMGWRVALAIDDDERIIEMYTEEQQPALYIHSGYYARHPRRSSSGDSERDRQPRLKGLAGGADTGTVVDGNEHEPTTLEDRKRRSTSAEQRSDKPISFDFKLRLGSGEPTAAIERPVNRRASATAAHRLGLVHRSA